MYSDVRRNHIRTWQYRSERPVRQQRIRAPGNRVNSGRILCKTSAWRERSVFKSSCIFKQAVYAQRDRQYYPVLCHDGNDAYSSDVFSEYEGIFGDCLRAVDASGLCCSGCRLSVCRKDLRQDRHEKDSHGREYQHAHLKHRYVFCADVHSEHGCGSAECIETVFCGAAADDLCRVGDR